MTTAITMPWPSEPIVLQNDRSAPPEPRLRMAYLLIAFGPAGANATREELDALLVLSRRIADSIPISEPKPEPHLPRGPAPVTVRYECPICGGDHPRDAHQDSRTPPSFRATNEGEDR